MFKKYLLKLSILAMALGASGCHVMFSEDPQFYQPIRVVKKYPRTRILQNDSVSYRRYSPYENFSMYGPYGGFNYSSAPVVTYSPSPFVWSHTVIEDSYYPF